MDEWTMGEIETAALMADLTSLRRLGGRWARRAAGLNSRVFHLFDRHRDDERVAKLVHLFPLLLLARPRRLPRKGRCRRISLDKRRRFKLVEAGEWAPLLHDLRRLIHQPSTAPGHAQRPGRAPETAAQLSDEQREALALRVRVLVGEGELSRAAAVLRDLGGCPLQLSGVELLAELRRLHPEPVRPVSAADFAHATEAPLELDFVRFCDAIRHLPRCSAHGLDTWRFEAFQDMEKHAPQGLVPLFNICSDLVKGTFLPGGASVPPAVRSILTSARLIPLGKPNRGVRPIAVGSCFGRLIGRAIAQQCAARFADVLAPLQFGVAVPGGTEQMSHGARMLLAQHPDWVCLSADARNAYNSISRAAIVDALHELLPELVPWCEVCYGQHSRLVLRMAGGAEIVLSQRGVRQGDPLGPLLFALGIHHALRAVQSTAVGECDGARVLAYLDDVYLIGPLAWAERAYGVLREEFSAVGLELVDAKGKLYVPRLGAGVRAEDINIIPGADGRLRHGPTGVLVSKGFIKVVGIPVGEDGSAVFDQHKRIVEGTFSLLANIRGVLCDPQIQLLLVRLCVIPKSTHLLRAVPPDQLRALPLDIDARLDDAFAAILEAADSMDDTARLQSRMPLRRGYGGFGWTELGLIQDAAYLAGASTALNSLCDIDETWQRTVEAFAVAAAGGLGAAAGVLRAPLPPEVLFSEFALSLRQAHSQYCAEVPPERRAGICDDDLFRVIGAARVGFQRQLTRPLQAARRDAFRQRLCDAVADTEGGSPQERWRAIRRYLVWRDACAHGATAFLAVFPNPPRRVEEAEHGTCTGWAEMRARVFRLTAHMHLGIDSSVLAERPWCCARTSLRHPRHRHDALGDSLHADVGGFADPSGGASPTFRHNCWGDAWSDFLKAMGVRFERDPQGPFLGPNGAELLRLGANGQPLVDAEGFPRHVHKPDFLLPSFDGRVVLLDVNIRAPTAPSHRQRNRLGQADDRWTSAWEREKHATYRGWERHRPVPRIVPLVGTTTGRMGAEAISFFRQCLRQRVSRGDLNRAHLNSNRTAEFWLRRLSVGLRVAVAAMALRRYDLSVRRAAGQGAAAVPRRLRLATCQLLDVYAADTDSDADDAWDEPLGDSFRRAGPPPARGRDGARLAVAAG